MQKWRQQEADSWNESLNADDGLRQQAANAANEAGDKMYTRNNELNNNLTVQLVGLKELPLVYIQTIVIKYFTSWTRLLV